MSGNRFDELLLKVRWMVAVHARVDFEEVSAETRFVRDLGIDSLDLVEMLLKLEKEFEVSFDNSESQRVFTRGITTVRDLAEFVQKNMGAGRPDRAEWEAKRRTYSTGEVDSPSQLGGKLDAEEWSDVGLYRAIGENPQGFPLYQRRTDGMKCVLVPDGTAWIGSTAENALPDQKPLHRISLDPFLIDSEPVSTAAYARFLNSVPVEDEAILREWVLTEEWDHRRAFVPLKRENGVWLPLPGTEQLPMIMISWYGANAYSLWANGRDWRYFRADGSAPVSLKGLKIDGSRRLKKHHYSFLPSEAQWEYAARGAEPIKFPWGDTPEPSPELAVVGQHYRGREYTPTTLPMAPVSANLGISPFGLKHMAGNVWQWCKDWYHPDFYSQGKASKRNSVNTNPTHARCERGGSWVGPVSLIYSSYRRGRSPGARGRCLGFRCVGPNP